MFSREAIYSDIVELNITISSSICLHSMSALISLQHEFMGFFTFSRLRPHSGRESNLSRELRKQHFSLEPAPKIYFGQFLFNHDFPHLIPIIKRISIPRHETPQLRFSRTRTHRSQRREVPQETKHNVLIISSYFHARIALFSSFLSPFHKYRRKATTKDLIISLFDSERCVHAGTVIAIAMHSSLRRRDSPLFSRKNLKMLGVCHRPTHIQTNPLL